MMYPQVLGPWSLGPLFIPIPLEFTVNPQGIQVVAGALWLGVTKFHLFL